MVTPTDTQSFQWNSASAMGQEILAKNWGSTPLGPIETWPVSLRSLVQTMLNCPSPMFLAWGPSLISFYNDAYVPILGYRAATALGKPFAELWATIWDDISPLVEKAMAGESQRVVDMRLDVSRAQLPEESYWSFSYSPAFDDAGQVNGLFCVTGETTSRVLAERARAEADARLEFALSVGRGIGIWDWDVASDRVIADERFARLYGVDVELAKAGAPISTFFGGIHPDDRDRVEAEVAKAVGTLSSLNTEYRLLRTDGSVLWVTARGRCILGPDGKCARFPGVSFDISELKLSEERLLASRKARDFLRDMITRQRAEADPAAIQRLASEAIGQLMGVNRAGFYRVLADGRLMHGASWSDEGLAPVLGEHPADQFGTFARSERQAGRALVFRESNADPKLCDYAEQGVRAGICVPLLSNGQWVAGIYLHQASPRNWTEAEVTLATEMINQTWLSVERADAMESLARRIEAQDRMLRDQEKNLRGEYERREAAETQVRQLQKMEAVGQLTGGIAHDFNNMLAVVVSGLNLAQRRLAKGDVNVTEFMEGAMDGAKRAAALTRRLLAYARQQPLAPEILDANALLLGLTELLSRSLGSQVILTTELGNDIWPLKADASELENVIVNLAVNARDAMPQGGQVTIITANADMAAEDVGTTGMQPGQYVVIRVTDTGTGMSPEVLAKAFEPFFTTKPVGKGTGLGLSQVYGFIRQSDGYVHIQSEQGRGTLISLFLPRHSAPIGEKSLTNAEPTILRDGQPQTILVVDDERAVRTFTADTIRELGYTVIAVGSGDEALKHLEENLQISVLVTDFVMPEMSGSELAGAALLVRPDLKVLYVTAFASALGGLPPVGNHRVVLKPFTEQQITQAIRALLA